MSVLDILNQLQETYGKPSMMTLFTNETLYRSPMVPTDLPKMLFYRIEQCQEIQIIGKVPFTTEQVIANAIRLLIGSSLLPHKEFNMWEALPIKSWATLKTFIQEAYGRRLTLLSLRSMSGQNGYANHNMYNIFGGLDDDDPDNDTVTTITPVTNVAARAATMNSTLGTAPTAMPSVNAEIAAAINQLSANHSTIMSHMAALSLMPTPVNPTTRRTTATVPPIQQLAVPIQQQFPSRDFSAGRGGHRGGRGRGCGRGGRGCTPFVDYMRTQGRFGVGGSGQIVPYGGGIALFQPAVPNGPPAVRNPDFSNIYKHHNDWNVCFSGGFDIQDGHTSATYPFKKANHQQSFSCENAQQFIAAGYDPCTKGMHKTVLPSNRIA